MNIMMNKSTKTRENTIKNAFVKFDKMWNPHM